MNTDRHYTGIAREGGVEPQNMQHFMSNSPWSAEAVQKQVLDEVQARPELMEGGVLLVDESSDEKASGKSQRRAGETT